MIIAHLRQLVMMMRQSLGTMTVGTMTVEGPLDWVSSRYLLICGVGMIKRSVVFVAALLVLCSVSFAWSAKEHILLARCAARGLLENPAVPSDMKQEP